MSVETTTSVYCDRKHRQRRLIRTEDPQERRAREDAYQSSPALRIEWGGTITTLSDLCPACIKRVGSLVADILLTGDAEADDDDPATNTIDTETCPPVDSLTVRTPAPSAVQSAP